MVSRAASRLGLSRQAPIAAWRSWGSSWSALPAEREARVHEPSPLCARGPGLAALVGLQAAATAVAECWRPVRPSSGRRFVATAATGGGLAAWAVHAGSARGRARRSRDGSRACAADFSTRLAKVTGDHELAELMAVYSRWRTPSARATTRSTSRSCPRHHPPGHPGRDRPAGQTGRSSSRTAPPRPPGTRPAAGSVCSRRCSAPAGRMRDPRGRRRSDTVGPQRDDSFPRARAGGWSAPGSGNADSFTRATKETYRAVRRSFHLNTQRHTLYMVERLTPSCAGARMWKRPSAS